jgi:hypothetical protein
MEAKSKGGGRGCAHVLVRVRVAHHLNRHTLVNLVVLPPTHAQRPPLGQRQLSLDVSRRRVQAVLARDWDYAYEVVVVPLLHVGHKPAHVRAFGTVLFCWC